MVPYLRAVCKPSFKANKREGRIRLASARQVVEPSSAGYASTEAISVKTKSVWSDLKITPQLLYFLPSFEIMQKAVVARIPIVAAVSAPSSLAVALARKFKMSLVGFLPVENCNIYAGAERIEA